MQKCSAVLKLSDFKLSIPSCWVFNNETGHKESISFLDAVAVNPKPNAIWEFPKIGDPNIVP